VNYALEGSVFNAGSSIEWLHNELGMIESPRQADELAASVPDTGGVYVVPAFTGLGAPYWDMYARGTVTGLTRGTRREHFVRAVLESIAYQSRDVFEAMCSDTGVELKELKVDGGVSNSSFVMQFQADILGIPVIRQGINETTALGAAFLAGLGAGVWGSREEIASTCSVGRVFKPSMNVDARSEKYGNWKRAVERSMDWEKK
jgi:glycerol kinase